VAQQIKEAILGGFLKPGHRLPAERELAEHFQTSRLSVREALKGLETSGLLLIKPGSGVFVSEVSSRPMSESLSSILQMKKASIDVLTEARLLFEPSIARLACERMGDEDLLKLERNIREASRISTQGMPLREKSIEFHLLIAEATHNPVVALSMKTFLDVLREMSSKIVDPSPEDIASQALIYHRKILKAVRQKNAKRVQDLMQKHILQMQRGYRKAESRGKRKK
jgi:DNA-binding FadR family transcriptional regulator